MIRRAVEQRPDDGAIADSYGTCLLRQGKISAAIVELRRAQNLSPGDPVILEHLGEAVRATHEAWDGSGYPDGLRGDEIPLAARIVSCADAFDAMTSDRAYRRALPPEEACRRIERDAGRQFDPLVAAALLEVVADEVSAG